MDPSDDRLKALTASVTDHIRATLERELASLVSELHASSADDRESAVQQAHREAQEATRSLVSSAIASERAASDDRLKAERAAADDRMKAAVDEARAEWLVRERNASLARSERLLGSVRSLDNAPTLTDVLDRLLPAARDEAGLAALLVVNGSTLRGWSHAGFHEGMLPAVEISIPARDSGLLGTALRTKDRATSTDLPRDGGLAATPFTLSSDDRVGIAVPLLVDGEPVGVVYADDDGDAERAVPSAWPECVELLVRHAGRCLESLTARRASAPLSLRAVSAADPKRTDDEGAQRFARLLISEIKLYHAPLVDEGRRAHDLRQRLHDQIARARQLYDEKVSPALGRQADYFEQELVRTLADGNPMLLGQRS